MKRPAKQPSQPASKPNKWNIYHIKGTPAVLLGQVEAPDEESAIKRAIEEFKISPSGELNRWPAGAGGSPARLGRHWPMGVRTRGLDIATNAKRQVADAAARAEAKAVVERWNEQLVASRDMLWSPTIRAALIAGTPWLDVFCPGCGTSRAIDLRKVDRHPLASVATLVLGLRCSWCPESAPMPRILGLHALPPATKAAASNL